MVRNYLLRFEVAERLAVEFGETLDLGKVEPSFAGLSLRDEGLRLFQPFGDLDLCQPGVSAGLPEFFKERLIAFGVDAGHGLPLEAGEVIVVSLFGISQNGIYYGG